MIPTKRPTIWTALVRARIAKRGRHERPWLGTDTYDEVANEKADGRHLRGVA